ncbi:hypothetical protein KJ359_000479 [Pestalotiopsis sp. 9143b]|nr:hypothetical protein KJ359_000479 [Pestalotiopsis sp. 9143b]
MDPDGNITQAGEGSYIDPFDRPIPLRPVRLVSAPTIEPNAGRESNIMRPRQSEDPDEQMDLSRVCWPHLYCMDGDTLIVIDFPKRDAQSCNGHRWSGRKEFTMQSAVLLGTKSAFFENALSEKQQSRYKSRYLKRSPSDSLPLGISYILDVTPSEEGDDAAALLADLSVPAGARKWWMSMERLGVSASLVSGHDDNCTSHGDMPVKCIKDPEYVPGPRNLHDDNFKYKITLGLDKCEPCPEREIQDYCEIRHRAAIIRLLMFVAGFDLILNSAPRVWTIVGLAKQFGLTTLVSSPVRCWLEDSRNSSFIDIHPEITLEMAWKLQLSDMVRAPLRIIIVERALDRSPADAKSPVTVFDRPRADLSDDISEVVQHATEAVRTRLEETYALFQSEGVFEWLEVKVWRALTNIRSILASDIQKINNHVYQMDAQHFLGQLDLALDACRTHLTNWIDQSFKASMSSENCEEIISDRLAYASKGLTPVAFESILLSFNYKQFLLMPIFWNKLRSQISLAESFKNIIVPSDSHPSQRTLDTLFEDLSLVMNDPDVMMRWSPTLRRAYPNGLDLSFQEFHGQLYRTVAQLARGWVPTADDLETPLRRSTHLALGILEEEFKFLPLWAGGRDDGTGAVFTDMSVPDTDMGAIEPGPKYRTGQTIAASSTADSDGTIINGGVSLGAVASGSTMTTGLSQVDLDEVMSISEVVTISEAASVSETATLSEGASFSDIASISGVESLSEDDGEGPVGARDEDPIETDDEGPIWTDDEDDWSMVD